MNTLVWLLVALVASFALALWAGFSHSPRWSPWWAKIVSDVVLLATVLGGLLAVWTLYVGLLGLHHDDGLPVTYTGLVLVLIAVLALAMFVVFWWRRSAKAWLASIPLAAIPLVWTLTAQTWTY